jgi:hypothetical protein
MFYKVPTTQAGVTMQVETLTDPVGRSGIGEAAIRGLHVSEDAGPEWDYAKDLGELIGVQATRGGAESGAH